MATRVGRWAVAAAAVRALALTPAARAQAPDLTKPDESQIPAEIKGLTIVEHLGQKVPLDLTFTDSDGRTVKLADYFNQGRPVLLQLVYFRCPLQCPFTLQKYTQSYRQLTDWTIGRQFNVVVVSFDATETPADARKSKIEQTISYDRTPREVVDGGWAFLTTPNALTSRALADAVGFQYRYMPVNNEYSHPTATFVLMPDGTISRYLYGLETPSRDLRLALLEAGEGKIGNTVDKLLLFCFHFDPKSGSYTLAAWRVMQLGGAVSAVAVAGIIGAMLMVERRRKRARAGLTDTTTTSPAASAAGPTTGFAR